MIVCPYCGQDYIHEISIEWFPQNLHMCPECDTVWTQNEEIKCGTGKTYTVFAKEHGHAEYGSKVPEIKILRVIS